MNTNTMKLVNIQYEKITHACTHPSAFSMITKHVMSFYVSVFLNMKQNMTRQDKQNITNHPDSNNSIS